jgi:RHH-type rel operon transcriptional repressor/antitoxin RelB
MCTTQHSKSFLASEAIREVVETNEWQIGEIQAAIGEADAGDFASEHDAQAFAKKWLTSRGLVAQVECQAHAN